MKKINLDNRFPFAKDNLLPSLDTTYFSKSFLKKYIDNPQEFVKTLNYIKNNSPELKLLQWKVEVLKLYLDKITELYNKYKAILNDAISKYSFADIYKTIYNPSVSQWIKIASLENLTKELNSLEKQWYDKWVIFAFIFLKLLVNNSYSIKDQHSLSHISNFNQANEFVCLKDIFPVDIKVFYLLSAKPSFYLNKLKFLLENTDIVIYWYNKWTLDHEVKEWPYKIGIITIPDEYYLIMKNFINGK